MKKKLIISISVIALIAIGIVVLLWFNKEGGSSKEFLDMYERQQEIVIEIAHPISQEQGTEIKYEWTELAYLNNYAEFREVFDDLLGVTIQGQGGKNGVVYVDPSTKQHTNNSTLKYAFANQKFLDKCWDNTETMKALMDEVKNNFVDVETDAVARLAVLNTYFNIIPDAEPNYFNGGQTLTRGEFLAALYRAETPVHELQMDEQFMSLVDPSGNEDSTIFASYLQDYSYLTTADESLNASTFVGKITRAEAVYTIVKKYFANEYASVTGKESAYSDAKNGGDIAAEEGYNKTDKKFGKAYTLKHSLKYIKGGMPEDLYKALVVAKQKGLINGAESRWDEALTKAEFLSLIENTYEALGTPYSADRGASKGEVVDNGNTNSEKEELQEMLGIQDKSEFDITEEDFYYDEDGKLQYSNNLIKFVNSFTFFNTLSYTEIARVIETPTFESWWDYGKLLGDIKGNLTVNLSLELTAKAIINEALSNFSGGNTNEGTNGSGGKVDIADKDSNKGGSEENEKVSEDDFVTPDTPVKEEEKVPTITWGDNGEFTFTEVNKLMYATESVNLRQGPSTSYDKTGNVPKGNPVHVIAKCNENDWYMVYYMGSVHFVTSKYISETAPVIATPTPTPEVTKPSVTPSAKPTVTPKPQPTQSPKPTGKVTVDNIVTQDGKQGTIYNGVFVPSTTGEYITVEGKTTLVIDGLDGCNVKIPMPTREERLAWRKKYPDARIIGSGENSIFIPDPGDGGPLGGGSLDLKAN